MAHQRVVSLNLTLKVRFKGLQLFLSTHFVTVEQEIDNEIFQKMRNVFFRRVVVNVIQFSEVVRCPADADLP